LNRKDTKARRNTKWMYLKLSDRAEWIAKQVVDIAVNIHKQLGPGLLESVYAKCFYYELSNRSSHFEREKLVPIIYNELEIDEGLRLDCLVEELVIIEFKAQENYHPVWEAQLMSYLKLTNKRLGFLINSHVPLMKDGIKRIII